MKYTYAFVVIFLLLSCERDETLKEIKLEEITSQKVNSHCIELPVEILSPRQIYCLKHGFVIKDNVKMGFIKYVPYSLDTMFNYGSIGNGSGEFNLPNISQFDSERLLLSSINPNDQILKFEEREIISTPLDFKHKNHFIGSNYIAHIDNDTYLVYKMSDSQVEIVDDSTGDVQGYDFFPFNFNDNVSKFNKANVIFNSLMMSYSQSSNTLFIGFYLFPYSINVDMSTKEIVSNTKISSSIPENRYTIDSRGGLVYDNPVVYYFNHVSTSDYNWIYYRGYRRSEIGSKQPEIHQFTKDGELIKRYIFDRELIHFGVSPDNKTIYALTLNNNQIIEVVKFDI